MYSDNDFRLYHHGIKGQKWGIQHGPPYPLDDAVSTGKRLKKAGKLPKSATYQNLDDWGRSGKTNVLYISGKSGSGKSTVALGLRGKNTEVIHLDSYFDNPMGPKSSDFNEYLKRTRSDYAKLSLPKDKISLSEWGKAAARFEESIEHYGEDAYKRGKNVIVEGVQLLDDTIRPDKSYFNDKPFILLNTNSLVSIKRGNERDGKKFELNDIRNSLAWNKDVKNLKRHNTLQHGERRVNGYL